MTETIAAEIVIFLALFALWVAVLRAAWRAWQPARLLLAGRHAEARAAAERLQHSWMRVFRSVRLSTRYAIGCALHLDGDLEGSIAALAPLHEARVRGNLRYAICSIDAANLILLDREHARACKLLEEAARVHRPPEDILLAAHARHGLGETSAAADLFLAAGHERSSGGTRLGSTLLLEDRRQQEAIFHALRGLYLAKIGRLADAQRDLEIAAKSPITNVYIARARAMQSGAVSVHEKAWSIDPDDSRSSLAPQIVANETAADE